jgi:hypothetical protein
MASGDAPHVLPRRLVAMQWWAWLLVALEVTLTLYAAFVCWLVVVGRREDARAFATFIPDCIVLVSRLAREPRVLVVASFC